jgi:ubiquitin-protein ligase E3 D
MAFIHLYAELLLSLRIVTVYLSFESDHTNTTTATLSADGETVTVSNRGKIAIIRLPIKIQAAAKDVAFTLPAEPSKQITLRLKDPRRLPPSSSQDERASNNIPWAAKDMSDQVEVQCAACHHTLIPTQTISSWRNLPRADWAEMMDFWHCHKPDEHDSNGTGGSNNDASSRKGYAAANRWTARRGVCFVDLLSFLVAREDCPGVKVRFLFP